MTSLLLRHITMVQDSFRTQYIYVRNIDRNSVSQLLWSLFDFFCPMSHSVIFKSHGGWWQRDAWVRSRRTRDWCYEQHHTLTGNQPIHRGWPSDPCLTEGNGSCGQDAITCIYIPTSSGWTLDVQLKQHTNIITLLTHCKLTHRNVQASQYRLAKRDELTASVGI